MNTTSWTEPRQVQVPRQRSGADGGQQRTPRLLRAGGEVSRVIAVGPAELYGMVVDVRRMGEWSPECRSCEWLDGATAATPGARFRGHNRSGMTRWSRVCEVVAAEPGREFAFRTVPQGIYRDATVWRYRFEAVEGGTRVTESYEITLGMPPLLERLCARMLPQHIDMRPQMAATLERIAAVAERRAVVEQLRLPGQADAPAGPIDASGMYLLHFALRRDLDTFVRAVAATPLLDADTWCKMRDRWDRFANVLHKHHGVEDAALWPLLLARAGAAGDDTAAATLTAMEAEHGDVDPLGRAVADGFGRVIADRSETNRVELLHQVEAFRERLLEHLAHEERDAMRLVQTHLSPADWAELEKQFAAAYSAKDIPFSLGWTLHRLPEAGRRRLAEVAGPLWALVSVLGPLFDRQERRVFRYVD